MLILVSYNKNIKYKWKQNVKDERGISLKFLFPWNSNNTSFKARWQQKVTYTHTLIKHAQSSATNRHMGQRYIKPISGRYRLHSLHGQFCGKQFLIPDLKTLKVFISFNSVGTISQIVGPKNDRLIGFQFHYIHF